MASAFDSQKLISIPKYLWQKDAALSFQRISCNKRQVKIASCPRTGRCQQAYGDALGMPAWILVENRVRSRCADHAGPFLHSENCDYHTFCMATARKNGFIFSS